MLSRAEILVSKYYGKFSGIRNDQQLFGGLQALPKQLERKRKKDL
jgi:hypothetical protein